MPALLPARADKPEPTARRDCAAEPLVPGIAIGAVVDDPMPSARVVDCMVESRVASLTVGAGVAEAVTELRCGTVVVGSVENVSLAKRETALQPPITVSVLSANAQRIARDFNDGEVCVGDMVAPAGEGRCVSYRQLHL
jgi:hypothetical protein